MVAYDQETEQPHYYCEGDTAREIARRRQELDTSVSNPEWLREQDVPANLIPAPAPAIEPPPRRADYALTDAGMRLFRRMRAAWYFRHTGRYLMGSLELVNKVFDLVARNFRARNNR